MRVTAYPWYDRVLESHTEPGVRRNDEGHTPDDPLSEGWVCVMERLKNRIEVCFCSLAILCDALLKLKLD